MPILKSIGANKKVKNKVYTQIPASLKRVLEYVSRKGKNQDEVYKSYGIGLSDNTDKAFKQIMFNKNAFNKADGRQYKHYVTSYPIGYNDLETIEKITTQFAEENFLNRGFKCYVAIHKDKDHYHSHIIVDSVNFINGYKLQELDEKQLLKARYKDKKLEDWEVRLEDLKKSMEEIALEYGVPSPERSLGKAKTKNIGKMAKYKALKKNNSWRNKIAKIWEETILEETTTWKNLEKKLNERGIYFNRFNAENKAITLATDYEVGEETKKGKVRLNKLASEEDYRFQTTPNVFEWDNFTKILDKHEEKEYKEKLENIIKTFSKPVDSGLEKELKISEKEIKDEIYNYFVFPTDIGIEQTEKVLNNLRKEKNEVVIDKMLKVLPEVFGRNRTIEAWDFEPIMEEVLEYRKDELKELEKIKPKKYEEEIAFSPWDYYESKKKKEEEIEKDYLKEYIKEYKPTKPNKEEEIEEKVEEKKPQVQEKVVVKEIKKNKTFKELREDIYKFIESKGDLILLDAVNLLEDYKTNENKEIIDYIIKVLPSVVENIDGYKTVVAEDFKYNIEKKLEDARIKEIQKEVPKFFRKDMDFINEK
jgi:relaxase/mobilization nuclease